jgi:hypothetical protein
VQTFDGVHCRERAPLRGRVAQRGEEARLSDFVAELRTRVAPVGAAMMLGARVRMLSVLKPDVRRGLASGPPRSNPNDWKGEEPGGQRGGHHWLDRSGRPMRSAAIWQQIETRTKERWRLVPPDQDRER